MVKMAPTGVFPLGVATAAPPIPWFPEHEPALCGIQLTRGANGGGFPRQESGTGSIVPIYMLRVLKVDHLGSPSETAPETELRRPAAPKSSGELSQAP